MTKMRFNLALLVGFLLAFALLPLSHAGAGIHFNAEYIIAGPDVEVCLADTYGVYNPFDGDVKVEVTITDDLVRFLSPDSPSSVEIDVPAQTSSAEFIQVPEICFTVLDSECDSIAGENGINGKVIVTEIRDGASTSASGSAARTVLSADLDFRCDPGLSPGDEASGGVNLTWLWAVLIIIIVVLIIFFVVKRNRSSVSGSRLSLA